MQRRININLDDLQNFPSYKTLIKITLLLSDLQKSDSGLKYITSTNDYTTGAIISYIRNQVSLIQESLYLYDKSISISEPFCRNIKDDEYIKKDKARVDRALNENWKNYMKHIRDKVGFHYDDDIIKYSRSDIFTQINPNFSITRGEGMQKWQFPGIENIITSYVLDHAPKQYGINLNRYQILKRLDFIRISLLSYYSEFVWVYLESYEQHKTQKE